MQHGAPPGASEPSTPGNPEVPSEAVISNGSTVSVPSLEVIPVSRWVSLCRPSMLLFSAVPVFFTLVYLGALGDRVVPVLAILTLLAASLVHAGANVLDEYLDYERLQRADLPLESNTIFPSGGVLATSDIPPLLALRFGIGLLVAGTIVGIPLAGVGGLPVVLIGMTGLLGSVLYSSTSFALKHLPGGGEIAAFLALGPGIVIVTTLIQHQRITPALILIACAIGLLTAMVVLVVHMGRMPQDAASGRRTIATVAGESKSRAFVSLLGFVAYVCVFIAVFRLGAPYGLLAVVLAIPAGILAATSALRAASTAAWRMAAEQMVREYLYFLGWALAGLVINTAVLRILPIISFVR